MYPTVVSVNSFIIDGAGCQDFGRLRDLQGKLPPYRCTPAIQCGTIWASAGSHRPADTLGRTWATADLKIHNLVARHDYTPARGNRSKEQDYSLAIADLPLENGFQAFQGPALNAHSLPWQEGRAP